LLILFTQRVKKVCYANAYTLFCLLRLCGSNCRIWDKG
jgi:hypothetical protein